jgi:hypothetical protein
MHQYHTVHITAHFKIWLRVLGYGGERGERRSQLVYPEGYIFVR